MHIRIKILLKGYMGIPKIGFILLSTVIIFGMFQCYYLTTPQLTNKDKSELVQMTLVKVLEEKVEPFYSVLQDTGCVVLTNYSLEGMSSIQLFTIDLKILDKNAMKTRADSIGPYRCFHFLFDIVNNDNVIVILHLVWILPDEEIGSEYINRPMLAIKFHKERGMWKPGEILHTESRY